MTDTAVILAGGRGTRLAPLTPAVPKELLPLGRLPMIDRIITELERNGMTRVIVVGSAEKPGLDRHLEGRAEVVHQQHPRGTGDALLAAEEPVAGRPFALVLPDALIVDRAGAPAPLLGRMTAAAPCVAVEDVEPERVSRFGIVAPGEADARVPGAHAIEEIVEKPDPAAAPSRSAVCARYVLPGSIFGRLRELEPRAGGEIHITDAIAAAVADGEHWAAVPLASGERRVDAGTLDQYVTAFCEAAAW